MNIQLLHTEDDAKKYWQLRLEALQNNPEAFGATYTESINRPNPVERVFNRINEEGNYTFGMKNEHGELLGVCTLLRPGISKEKHKAHIYAMYVTPTARKAAVGKSLVTAAIEKASGLGIEQVLLSVVTTNIAGKKLYESVGFKTYGTEKNALKDEAGVYWDENHMVLFINE